MTNQYNKRLPSVLLATVVTFAAYIPAWQCEAWVWCYGQGLLRLIAIRCHYRIFGNHAFIHCPMFGPTNAFRHVDAVIGTGSKTSGPAQIVAVPTTAGRLVDADAIRAELKTGGLCIRHMVVTVVVSRRTIIPEPRPTGNDCTC